jgi:hypothetical protein
MPGNANSSRRPAGYTQLSKKSKRSAPIEIGTLHYQSSTEPTAIFEKLRERIKRTGIVRSYDDYALSDFAHAVAAFREKPTAALSAQVMALYRQFALTPVSRQGLPDV